MSLNLLLGAPHTLLLRIPEYRRGNLKPHLVYSTICGCQLMEKAVPHVAQTGLAPNYILASEKWKPGNPTQKPWIGNACYSRPISRLRHDVPTDSLALKIVVNFVSCHHQWRIVHQVSHNGISKLIYADRIRAIIPGRLKAYNKQQLLTMNLKSPMKVWISL